MSDGTDDSLIGSCRSLNSTTLTVNTTATINNTYVRVQCTKGYQLTTIYQTTPSSSSSSSIQNDVFHCMNSVWLPSTPRCVAAQNSGIPVGVVVGCTIGGVLCLLVVLIAVYLLCRTRDDSQMDKQNDMLHKAKMMHMNFFMTSFQQHDNVGMPVVTAESVDLDMRGVSSYDDDVRSYGSMETGGKLYRSSGSVFGESNDGSDDEQNRSKNKSKC